MGKVKHEMEESSGGVASKQCRVKELERLPNPKELGKINFLGCTHGSIWTLMKEEANWAKKIGLIKIRKLDWTSVNGPIVKEMISSYKHADQYVRLKGRQIDVKKGVARIFGLSCEGIVPIGRESYNLVVVTYFIRDEHEHYILHSCYLIAKIDGRQKVAILEAMTEIMSFRQGNKFVPSALISTMLAAEKEKVNRATWYSQKLQNEIIIIQHRARKIGNTLAGPALTIIGHHFLKQWEPKKEESIGTRKKTQNKKEKMIVDVNAILLVKKKKKKKGKLAITISKEITEVSFTQEGNPSEVVEASIILSDIGGKHVEIPSEVMTKPLVHNVEEVGTKLVEEKGI